MAYRAIASLLVLLAVSSASGQDAFIKDSPRIAARGPAGNIESAWLDLRQTTTVNSTPQTAPDWVESVTIIPAEATGGPQPQP